MPKSKILIIEDEPDIAEMITYNLQREGYKTLSCRDGEVGLSRIHTDNPDLVILDLMLPGIDGIEVCRRVKSDPVTRSTPIIMLTAKSEEDNKIQGLDVGADDYITKPFSTRELISRIKAVLRRASSTAADKAIEVEGLCLDPVSHRISADDEPVDMGPTEYRLLEFFMSPQERAYSRTQLLDQVWGANVYVEDRTIDVHIRRLRKALAPFGYDRFIQTVRGTGYRFSVKSAKAG